MNSSVTRRTFAANEPDLEPRLGPQDCQGIFGLVLVLRLLGDLAVDMSQVSRPSCQRQGKNAAKEDEGKPGGEKDVIMPVIVHNGLIYVSGQGAHDTRDAKQWTIESHTAMVMDKVKKMVEIGGGTTDTILQLNVYLTKIEHWDGMHKVFSTYFPHGGPARTTVAVAALPGDSLVEINCTAAVARK